MYSVDYKQCPLSHPQVMSMPYNSLERKTLHHLYMDHACIIRTMHVIHASYNAPGSTLMSRPEGSSEVLLVFYNTHSIHVICNQYVFHIFYSVFHVLNRVFSWCHWLPALPTKYCNLPRLSLYGGNCRGCGGGESAETGLIIIRQDALCSDFGFGANPKSNACLRGSIEEGRLGRGRVTIHGHMPSCSPYTEVKTL